MALRDRIGFYQAVRARLLKVSVDVERDFDELDSAVRQIVSGAVSSDQVIDVFSAAGLHRPDISILSDEFLHQVSELPQQHLALEALRKLLSDEIKERSRKSVIQARLISEMLAGSIRRYQDRTIQTAEVIAELVDLARQMRDAPRRGEALGLTDDELAFYDALSLADDAVQAMGSDKLCALAKELTESIRKNATIDWTERDSSRARLRVTVRLLLLRNGYPSSLIDQAAHTILEQAGLLTKEWAA